MASYCVVDPNGNVVNVIEWDGVSEYKEPSSYQLVLDPLPQVGIGWTYANGVFTNPNQGN